MTGEELRVLLERVLEAMPAHADELRALDAALGDGDLGITVSAGSAAVRSALEALEAPPDVRQVLLAAAKAFSTANPSTFAALIGGGLLAAAKAVEGRTELGRADALTIGEAAAARIAERGKAQLGDKTVLDALVPSLDTLRSYAGDDAGALDAMIETARDQLVVTAALRSARGRAAWVQERSMGHPDPGATAYLRFLEELRSAWSAE
jgi:dihydroxyacetone kinase-like protein